MNFPTTRTLAAFLCALSLGAATSLSQNLIGNGSFEAPVVTYFDTSVPGGSTFITGWTITGSGALRLFHGPNVDSPMGAYDGDQFIAFNAGTDPAGTILSQNLNTAVGETYTVSFVLGRAGYMAGSLQMMVEARSPSSTLLSSRTYAAPTGTTPGWGSLSSFSFTAQDNQTLLAFKDVSPDVLDTDLLIDKVSVVPEPSTTVLLSIGVGCLVAAARRRR